VKKEFVSFCSRTFDDQFNRYIPHYVSIVVKLELVDSFSDLILHRGNVESAQDRVNENGEIGATHFSSTGRYRVRSTFNVSFVERCCLRV